MSLEDRRGFMGATTISSADQKFAEDGNLETADVVSEVFAYALSRDANVVAELGSSGSV